MESALVTNVSQFYPRAHLHRVGSHTDPFVMWFVDVFVDAGVVLEPVNPVDQEVVPDHEQHNRDTHPRPSIVLYSGIQEALSAHLGQEKGQREDVDPRYSHHRGHNLLSDLVLEEARMVFEPPVEDEVVRERAKDPV